MTIHVQKEQKKIASGRLEIQQFFRCRNVVLRKLISLCSSEHCNITFLQQILAHSLLLAIRFSILKTQFISGLVHQHYVIHYFILNSTPPSVCLRCSPIFKYQ